MAVLVTIVVPLISRTVVDVAITRQQEEQARAFSVAETGLERVLVGEAGAESGTIGDIDYTVTKTGKGEDALFIYPKRLERDFPVTVWLIEHTGADFSPEAAIDFGGSRYTEGQIIFAWGAPGTPADAEDTPALEATLFYEEGGNVKVEKFAYNPNTTKGDGFDSAVIGNFSVGGENFAFQAGAVVDCDLGRTCYALRVRLLYSDEAQPLAIEGESELPRQGLCYQSRATLASSGVTSRVERCVFYKTFPSIFDFAVYSGSNLQK